MHWTYGSLALLFFIIGIIVPGCWLVALIFLILAWCHAPFPGQTQ